MKFGFKKSHIPNYLTMLRLILVVIILALILSISRDDIRYAILSDTSGFDHVVYTITFKFNLDKPIINYFNIEWLIAGVLFVIAALSDALDGYLARKYKWTSTWGKFWDPIADKVLIDTILIALAFMRIVPISGTIIMVARDIIVDAYRMTAASQNVVVAANQAGKWKTILQMIALILIFFVFNLPVGITDKNPQMVWVYYFLIQNLFIISASIISIVSGIIYIHQINIKMKELKLKKK